MRAADTYRGARRNFRRSDRATGRRRGAWRGVATVAPRVRTGEEAANLLMRMPALAQLSFFRGKYFPRVLVSA